VIFLLLLVDPRQLTLDRTDPAAQIVAVLLQTDEIGR
jgi:hypothetical protein